MDVRPYQEPIIGDGTGLLGRYFAAQDLTALALRRIDPTVGLNWGEGAPAAEMPADHFAVRWTGWVQPEYTDRTPSAPPPMMASGCGSVANW